MRNRLHPFLNHILGGSVKMRPKKIGQLRSDLEAQVANSNTNIAAGKWNHMMSGLVTGKDLNRWSSQVRWPWGESASAKPAVSANEPPNSQSWRDAATADRQLTQGAARWCMVEGLGPSGRAMSLQPASLVASWKEDDTNAPALEYRFVTKDAAARRRCLHRAVGRKTDKFIANEQPVITNSLRLNLVAHRIQCIHPCEHVFNLFGRDDAGVTRAPDDAG